MRKALSLAAVVTAAAALVAVPGVASAAPPVKQVQWVACPADVALPGLECGKLQVPLDYRYPSEIRRALGRAHAELEEKGFLSGIEYGEGAGVLYRISPAFARRQKALELSGTPQEMSRVIERLSLLAGALSWPCWREPQCAGG